MQLLSKAKIKLIRSLRQKKYRDIEDRFVVEGEKLIDDILKFNADLIEFVVTEEGEKKYESKTLWTTKKELKELSNLMNPTSAIAVVLKPKIKTTSSETRIILDGIQDPGNLGTIIRTAEWFGIQSLICSKDTVDAFNPKVVQASMGSVVRLNIEYLDLGEYLDQSELPTFGALMNGNNIYDEKLPKKANYVLGNEGKGIRADITTKITRPITIPGNGNAESLNVAIAGAIIMSEIFKPS